MTAIFAENGQKERINVIKNLSTYRKESEAVITHRCKGSLKAGVSIRYAYQWPYMLRSPSEKQAWRMITYGVGDEYMDTVIETSDTEINFCPFCGQKLEAPEQAIKGKTSDER